MAVNDDFGYSYQKPAPRKLAERALITLERTQKLDLLIHLLTNLHQSLVLCGPHGIGKTTLLQTLVATRADRWQFCQIQGNSAQSFESILQQLSRTLNIFGSSIQLDIGALCDSCQKQNVILVIDDAGELMPGLIGELIGFAEPLQGLRLVFAMTYDEFHIKNNSDRALDDCHVIELPPLNRKQCLDYLQNLSAHPDMPLTFNGITDSMVDDLFRETHGIPGRILAELPRLDHYHDRQHKKWWLAAGLAGLVAGGGYMAYALTSESSIAESRQQPIATATPTPTSTPSATPTNAPTSTPEPTTAPALVATTVPTPSAQPSVTPSATSKPTATLKATSTNKPTATSKPTASSTPSPSPSPTPKPTATSTPTPTSKASPTALPASLTPTTTATVAPTSVSTLTPTPIGTPQATSTPTPAPTVTPTPISETVTPSPKPLAAPPEKKAASETAAEKSAQPQSDQEWIMAQPANNFTLQVMTLSQRDGLRRFMKKYAEYGESLKYYTVRNGDQERFILIYGSFDSVAEAKRYKEILPGEFKQALEKRFRTIQKESRR